MKEAHPDRQNGAGMRGLKELREGQHLQLKEAPSFIRDFKDRLKQGEKGGQSISWQRGRHVSPVTILYTGTLARIYKNYFVCHIPLPHSHLAMSLFLHASLSPHSATVCRHRCDVQVEGPWSGVFTSELKSNPAKQWERARAGLGILKKGLASPSWACCSECLPYLQKIISKALIIKLVGKKYCYIDIPMNLRSQKNTRDRRRKWFMSLPLPLLLKGPIFAAPKP